MAQLIKINVLTFKKLEADRNIFQLEKDFNQEQSGNQRNLEMISSTKF